MPKNSFPWTRVLAVATLGNLFWNVYFFVAFPLAADRLGLGNLTDQYYGYALALINGFVFLTAFPSGHISDLFGRKGIMIVGWTISGLGPFLLFLYTGLTVYFIAAALVGIGLGISGGPFHAYIADLTPDGSLSGRYGKINGFGILASAVGTLAIHQYTQVYLTEALVVPVIMGFSAVMMFAAGGMTLLLPERKRRPKKEFNGSMFSFDEFSRWEKRILRNVTLLSLVMGTGAGFTVLFFSRFFIGEFNASSDELFIIATVTTVLLAVGMFIAGRLGDTRDKMTLFLVLTAMAVPMALGVTLAPTLFVGGMFFGARMVFMNMTRPVWDAYVMENVNPSRRGKTTGVQHAAWNLAFMSGSAIGGHTLGLFGGWVFPLAGVIYISVVLVVTLDLRKMRNLLPLPDEKVSAGVTAIPRAPTI